nr:ribonuclease H-like domain-containing protein [Tanacetum cinerariifolium]
MPNYPSFFFANNIGAPHGDELGRINPLGIKCSKVFPLLGELVRSYLVQDSLDYKRSPKVRYLQHEYYVVWEVTEFGDSYKAPPDETAKDKGLAGEVSSSTKKKGRTVAITTEDMQKRKMILQAIVSHLEFMDVPIERDDLNQKCLTSLAPKWLVYTIFWRNRDDLDTMSLDDVYNHLKVYEPEWNASIATRWVILLESVEHQGVKTEGRESYKKDPKVEEPAPKAMIAIDGIGWDWGYMAEEDEASKNHVLVADEE